jgi:hypothetical protein
MKRFLLCAAALSASASMASAQEVTTDACVATSDGGIYCFDPETGANFQQGIIGVYQPGQDSSLAQIYNPNNPRTVPPNPIQPGDPYIPVILVRPGS